MPVAMGLWTAVAHLGQEMEGITLQQRQTGPRAGCLVSLYLVKSPALMWLKAASRRGTRHFNAMHTSSESCCHLLYFRDGNSPTVRVKTEGDGLIYTHFFLSLHLFCLFLFVSFLKNSELQVR